VNPVRQRVVENPTLIVDTTTAAMVAWLRAAGFVDGDLKDISDRPPEGVYLRRGTTYVFIATYEGRFCEAIIERLDQPKQPKRRVVGTGTIARSMDELVVVIGS
jgi:hypothetical protein